MPICLRFDTDSADFVESKVDFRTGKAKAAKITTMAITTSSSMRVKAAADKGRRQAKPGGTLGESFKTGKLKINPHRCNRPLIG